MIPLDSFVDRTNRLSLRTERLRLRRFRPEDFATALAHEMDARIMRYIRDPLPAEAIEEKVRGMLGPWSGTQGEWTALIVTLRDDDAMIGLVAIRLQALDTETVELGYRFHPDHQGRGYGTEAARAVLDFLFGTARVHKVVAYCVADNDASWRLLERLGMRREGRLRQHSRLAGAWRDELVYGLLRSESACP